MLYVKCFEKDSFLKMIQFYNSNHTTYTSTLKGSSKNWLINSLVEYYIIGILIGSFERIFSFIKTAL